MTPTDFGDTNAGQVESATCPPPRSPLADRAKRYRDAHPGRMAAAVTRCIRKKKMWLREYKRQHGCELCHEPDPRCLDFDHVRGKKLYNVSQMPRLGCSLAKMTEEVAKCRVICANCHRKSWVLENY